VKSNIVNINKEELEGKMKYHRFYSIPETAKVLKKSDEQVRRYAREGKIKVYKEWKSYWIEESDIRAFMMIDDKVKIESYNFFISEYENKVKNYHPNNDEGFKGSMNVLISLLTDFEIPLKESIIEEVKSMYI